MNPYVSVSIAMCLIVAVSLAATAYLAVMFNRRAKADLAAALAPLADVVQGEASVEDAEVKGRYGGHIVAGRMANASEGPGRVFQTELVDPAGGTAWVYTSTPKPGQSPRRSLDAGGADLPATLTPQLDDAVSAVLDPARERFRLDYDPAAGRLRLTRPMQTRRDIPDADAFSRQLDLLVAVGRINRHAQGAPDAEQPAAVHAVS